MKNIPDMVRIGPITYKVVEVNQLSNYGEVDNASQTITIRKMANEQEWVTFWHELIHSMITVSGRSDQNEEFVDAMANLIVDMFQKNGTSIVPVEG